MNRASVSIAAVTIREAVATLEVPERVQELLREKSDDLAKRIIKRIEASGGEVRDPDIVTDGFYFMLVRGSLVVGTVTDGVARVVTGDGQSYQSAVTDLPPSVTILERIQEPIR